MIKTVIFDLGGVLVRTEDPRPREELARKYQLSYQQLSDMIYRSESGIRAMVGEITTEEHWENIHQTIGLQDDSMQAFEKKFWGGDQLDETLIALIAGLREEYTTALLSNAWDNLRRLLVELWDIEEVFDHIFISAEIGLAKPDPSIYQYVIRTLGHSPSEMVFLDDFPENVAAARESGMNAIHFRSREQALAELRELLDADW